MTEEPTSQPPQPAGDEPIEEVDGLVGADRPGIALEPIEVLDGVPVLTDEHPVEPRRPPLLPVPMQAAAVAVTGFMAGLLTIVLFRRRHARPGGRRLSRLAEGKRVDARGNVVASRSFLVDVHLLGGRD
jgi:hypothetical protein